MPKLKLPSRPSLPHLPWGRTWTWCLCVSILVVLTLFLTGHKLFGLSDEISTLMAVLGLLMAPLLTAIIFPLIALLLAGLAALGAAILFFITPILAAISGLWAWFLATAVGQAIVAPLYTALAPVVLKIAPWLTTSKFAGKAWSAYKKRRKARLEKLKSKISPGNRKPRRKQT